MVSCMTVWNLKSWQVSSIDERIRGCERIEMDRVLKTFWWFIALILTWQGLELLIYHEVQPRVVDDIMAFLYLPFIYKAVE